MWEFVDYQKEIGNKIVEILQELGWAYLVAEERTRKSGMALWACERIAYKNYLIICPSKAIPGWEEHLKNLPLTKNYDIVSMDSLHTVDGDKYDMVILDEAHNFGSTARTKKKGAKRATMSERIKLGRQVMRNKPIIFISATPSAQGYYMLYNQINMCTWSPWRKYTTFYKWFEHYGIPEIVYTKQGPRTIRTKTKDDLVLTDVERGFIKYTRAQLGFTQEPTDKLHYLEPPEVFKQMYNTLQRNKVLEIDNHVILADSDMSLRTKLHQLEGATIKYIPEGETDHVSLLLKSIAFKAQWILDTFGDSDKLVIMHEYQAEAELLRGFFPKAMILQGSAYAEGVDLSHMDTLVVYSMSFRTVKYIQRRARQCGLYREDPIVVHYPLVKGAISDQVYKTVAENKENYNSKYYEEIYL